MNSEPRISVDRNRVEGTIRNYMATGGSFIFRQFARETGLPYNEVLVVSDYFAPYSKPSTGMDGAKYWPLGAISALAAVCTMEGNRRRGVPL